MQQEYYQRTIPTKVTENGRRLSFYAALWDQETTVTDWAEPYQRTAKYREVVRPGAFHDRIASSEPVLATVNHDEKYTFSEYPGTLLLQEDSKGLFATCELPTSDLGEYVRGLVNDGSLTGCSFRFPRVGNREQWTDGEVPLRELTSVKLLDVSLTDRPAYPATVGEVHLRSLPDYKLYTRKFRYLKLRWTLLNTLIP